MGIKREKIGDIVVFDEGSNIIVLNEIIDFVKINISSLTRFSKSYINIKRIDELYEKEVKTEELQIIISSLRLDNIVSELMKTSRTKAKEIVNSGRVFVNFENIIKDSKTLKEEDILTIRGKGRFIKNRRIILKVEKYL